MKECPVPKRSVPRCCCLLHFPTALSVVLIDPRGRALFHVSLFHFLLSHFPFTISISLVLRDNCSDHTCELHTLSFDSLARDSRPWESIARSPHPSTIEIASTANCIHPSEKKKYNPSPNCPAWFACVRNPHTKSRLSSALNNHVGSLLRLWKSDGFDSIRRFSASL